MTITIKTKVRCKAVDEVERQCRKGKVPCVVGEYTIRVGAHMNGVATYNSMNGTFHGITPWGTPFVSYSSRFDHTMWMQKLRAFFHEEIKA